VFSAFPMAFSVSKLHFVPGARPLAQKPAKVGIPSKALDVELGRFASADVFSAFPMAFSVSNLHFVPGDPAIGSTPLPEEGISTKALDVELCRFGSADVFSAFPMAFFVSNLHLVLGDPAISSKTPPRKRAFRPRLFTWNFVGSGLLTCSAHSQWHSLFPICIWSRGTQPLG